MERTRHIITKIRSLFDRIYNAGGVHVFGMSVINKILLLASNVLLSRILSKADNGLYSYAYNIISIVLIFSDVGMRVARLQFCCESNDTSKQKAITSFATRFGVITSLLCSIGTLIYATFFSLSLPGASSILKVLSLIYPFYFIYEIVGGSYRIQKNNKQFAKIALINGASYLLLTCVGAYFLSVIGVAIGKYVSYILPTIIGIYFLKSSYKEKYVLSRNEKKEIINYGLLIAITNGVSLILQYFDTLIVGMLMTNPIVVADYKIATIIPNALNFIPQACVTFIYPYFVSHMNEENWILNNTRKMQILLAIPNIIISALGVIFASFIIRLLYGQQYLTAVPVFRVLMVTYFFSATFRTVYGNVLAMLHLIKVNFVIGTADCVLNIVSDIIMIKSYGSIGAAYTTLIITIVSSILSGAYFHYHIHKLKTHGNQNGEV